MIQYPTNAVLKSLRKAVDELDKVVGHYEDSQEERDEVPEGDDLKEELDDQGIEFIMDAAVVAKSCRTLLAVAVAKLIADFNLEREEPLEYEI